jgi:hypothetical protein
MAGWLTSLGLAGAAAGIALGASVAAGAGAGALREDRCDVQVRSGHALETIAMPGLHILDRTAGPEPFALALPAGAQAVVCYRDDIVPAASDDKVLALGVPLVIGEMVRARRVGILEIADGRYRFRMLAGRLGAAEQAAVQARLEAYRHNAAGAAAAN